MYILQPGNLQNFEGDAYPQRYARFHWHREKIAEAAGFIRMIFRESKINDAVRPSGGVDEGHVAFKSPMQKLTFMCFSDVHIDIIC